MPDGIQGLMARASGPAMTPQPTLPGQGAPGGASSPGAPSPDLLQTAIARTMQQQRTADPAFVKNTAKQLMRVLSVMNVHIQGQFPDVAADLNGAWQKVKAAYDKLDKHSQSQSAISGPPLGFSGAGTPPPAAPMPGMR